MHRAYRAHLGQRLLVAGAIEQGIEHDLLYRAAERLRSTIGRGCRTPGTIHQRANDLIERWIRRIACIEQYEPRGALPLEYSFDHLRREPARQRDLIEGRPSRGADPLD